MKIVIEKDYDGYFEKLAHKLVALVEDPKYDTLVVTAGPYRAYGMAVYEIDKSTANVDFYSALRAGFGTLTGADLEGAAKLLSK